MAIAEANDFINGALADLGVSVIRTPRTKITLSSGTEEFVSGTEETITAVIHDKPFEYKNLEFGDVKQVNGYIMVSPLTEINKNDIITYNGFKYLVFVVSNMGPAGSVSVYKYCPLVLQE